MLELLIDLYENHLVQQGTADGREKNKPETHVKKQRAI